MDFMGAGCMFGNDTHVLIGVHGRDYNRKGVPVKLLNGLGGRREGEETPQETALREVLEEMFGIQDPKRTPEWPRILEDFCAQPPKKVIHMETPHYITFVYSIDDLCQFLHVWESVFTSPYYKVFPQTLEELLFTRIAPETAEVSHILLWPKSLTSSMYFLSNDVIHDLTVKS
jgi:hypothetical protein